MSIMRGALLVGVTILLGVGCAAVPVERDAVAQTGPPRCKYFPSPAFAVLVWSGPLECVQSPRLTDEELGQLVLDALDSLDPTERPWLLDSLPPADLRSPFCFAHFQMPGGGGLVVPC